MALAVAAAEFKRRMSEYLGRVLFKKERIVITRRGKPIAQIAPMGRAPDHLAGVRGWLDDSDPFFAIMDRIVAARSKHVPRVKRKR